MHIQTPGISVKCLCSCLYWFVNSPPPPHAYIYVCPLIYTYICGPRGLHLYVRTPPPHSSEVLYNDTRGHAHFKATRPESPKEKKKSIIFNDLCRWIIWSPTQGESEVACNDTGGHGQFKATRPESPTEQKKKGVALLPWNVVGQFCLTICTTLLNFNESGRKGPQPLSSAILLHTRCCVWCLCRSLQGTHLRMHTHTRGLKLLVYEALSY